MVGLTADLKAAQLAVQMESRMVDAMVGLKAAWKAESSAACWEWQKAGLKAVQLAVWLANKTADLKAVLMAVQKVEPMVAHWVGQMAVCWEKPRVVR